MAEVLRLQAVPQRREKRYETFSVTLGNSDVSCPRSGKFRHYSLRSRSDAEHYR